MAYKFQNNVFTLYNVFYINKLFFNIIFFYFQVSAAVGIVMNRSILSFVKQLYLMQIMAIRYRTK